MHTSILQLLLEAISGIAQSLAGSLDVVDANTDMAKALRLLVTVMRFEVGIILSAVVVGQLDDTFTIGPMVVVRDGLWAVVGEKVEIELVVGEFKLVDLLHAEELVEFDAGLWVLDPVMPCLVGRP